MGPILRIIQAKQDNNPIVDVDGSFLHRKYLSLANAGKNVAVPGPPTPPLTGWKLVSESTLQDVALHIPLVTSG